MHLLTKSVYFFLLGFVCDNALAAIDLVLFEDLPSLNAALVMLHLLFLPLPWTFASCSP